MLLFVALAWPLAAFGGVYRWAAVPYLAGCAAIALTQAGRIGRMDGGDLRLNLALAGVVALAWLQLLPLPESVLAWVSPATPALADTMRLAPRTAGWAPISVDPSATAWACGILTANVVLFVAAQALFSVGGVRGAIRSIAWLGMLCGALALAQTATHSRAIYWWWVPFGEGAEPFGTFVNRNHFATWVIMAAPVCFGYVVARLYRSAGDAPTHHGMSRLVDMLDGRTLSLFCAGVLMCVALFVNLSRSGIVGLAAAAIFMLALGRRQIDRNRRRWLGAYVAVTALCVALFADIGGLLGRVMETLDRGSGRQAIWRETLPVLEDFWAAGTGAGTYETAMLVYQESDRLFYFNQAHNQFLQILTEGGLLLSVPTVVVAMLFISLARLRIGADRTARVWLRLGAAGGLTAVAVQSIWETGLRMPANAALAVVLAAIVVHAPREDRHHDEDSHGTAARV